MKTAFMEYLDQLYWEGYAETFRENDPKEFRIQLIAFVCEHGRTAVNGYTKSKK